MFKSKGAGIKDEDILFLSANGTYRPQTKEEHRSLLGEKLAQRFKVYDHNSLDKENLRYMVKRLMITKFL